MGRILTSVLVAVALAACESAPTAPTPTSSTSVPPPSRVEPAPALCGPIPGPWVITANVGPDHIVTIRYPDVPSIPRLEFEIEAREGDAVYRPESSGYIRVGDLASQRFTFPTSKVRRVRARPVTACETFGHWSPWVEFTI